MQQDIVLLLAVAVRVIRNIYSAATLMCYAHTSDNIWWKASDFCWYSKFRLYYSAL